MRKNPGKFPLSCNLRIFMYPLQAVMFLCLVSSPGAWAKGSLLSGSVSTPILYDSTAYGIQPQSARTPVANVPGGLVATAAWYDFGMKLSWDVTDNGNGTYTYHYLFGPGWYPATNPKADSTTTPPTEPYVTNKNITAFDMQLGAGVTSLADLTDFTWNVYQFNGPNGSLVGRVGTGDAASYQKCNPLTGAVTGSVVNTSLLTVGDFTGETGYTDQTTQEEHYTTFNLFHGIQWLNPMNPSNPGNFIFTNDINFELTFTSTLSPGWGNFFANSTRTGSNNNNSDVVAYNASDTGYTYNALDIPLNYNYTVAVPGGIQDGVPPSVDSTSPASSSADVSIGRAVTATFSEPVEPSTAIAANFTLSGGGGQVTGTVSYDAATRIVTFIPQTPLLSGTNYTASLTTGIKDLHDNSLAVQYSWSFTTKDYEIADALRALHISVGLITADANDTALYDVAPFVNNHPASNGTINILDVLMILRRVVDASIW